MRTLPDAPSAVHPPTDACFRMHPATRPPLYAAVGTRFAGSLLCNGCEVVGYCSRQRRRILALQPALNLELRLGRECQALGCGTQQITHSLPLLLTELLLVYKIVVEGEDRVQHKLQFVPLDELSFQALLGHFMPEIKERRELCVVVEVHFPGHGSNRESDPLGDEWPAEHLPSVVGSLDRNRLDDGYLDLSEILLSYFNLDDRLALTVFFRDLVLLRRKNDQLLWLRFLDDIDR